MSVYVCVCVYTYARAQGGQRTVSALVLLELSLFLLRLSLIGLEFSRGTD